MTSISNHHRRTYGRSRRSRHSTRPNAWQRFEALSPNLIAVMVLWFALLLLGGSSRGDVVQLVLLRPLAVLVAAYGFWTLRWHHVVRHRFLAAMAAAIILLVALHLVPLPPETWMSLPGRRLIIALDQSVGLGGTWRPIAMAPAFAWNALFSLVVPLAVLLNGIQLSGDDLVRVGIAIFVGAFASAILAFFQLFGTPDGILYPYTIKIDRPEAVGVFANRNHQALLLAAMIPLLAAWAARRGVDAAVDDRRLITAVGLGLFLIPMLMVTGSRAGLVAGGIALTAAPFIFARGVKIRHRHSRSPAWWKYGAGVAIVFAIAGIFIATNRSVAIQRLIASLSQDDQRYGRWSVIIHNLDQFLPFGSGVGSYQPIFQTFESGTGLTDTYSNHAHNDWLEVILTAGIPGGLLLVISAFAFFVIAIKLLRSRDRGAVPAFRVAGLVIILIIALASLVDYPIRTPIISGLLVVACLWVGANCRRGWAPTPEATIGAE